MRIFNYRFYAEGAQNYGKTGLYRAAIPLPAQQGEQQTGGVRTFSNIKSPIGDTSGYWGKFILDTLILKTENDERIYMEEAVVSILKAKNIVTTAIVGGNGTVKEFISDADIDIKISAALVATDGAGNIIDEYPEQGIKDLRAVLDVPEAIYATSEFLRMFDINKIVIKDYSITQTTDSNRQEVTINAISDYDYTIYSEEA